MKNVTLIVAAVCSACVLIGALHMLCPDGVMQKPVKYLISLAFLVTLVATVLPAVQHVEWNWHISAAQSEQSAALETAAAEYVYASVLRAEGINFSKITVCTDKTQDGSISISKVIIVSNAESEKILSALRAVVENVKVVIQHE